MEAFSSIITSLENWIWGAPMLILLCGTHIFMTLRTGFIQKKTFTGIRLSVTKDPDSLGDVSQFQALTTALASTIGTGNIIGVGTAIYLGGPGAVLWCWLTGVFGIATKYAESLIAVKYRVQTADGRMMGGAMYALERGLKWKKFGKTLAMLFALFAMLASFGIGCGTQINAIAEVIETNLPIGIPRIAIGIVFGIVTAIIILGGIESIATVCEKLVPVMALFYVLGCIVILGINFDYILPAFRAIFTLAFRPGAVAGGLVGGGIRLALSGRRVVCMQGRLHGYEGYAPGEIAYPVYVLRELGIQALVVTNASGGINTGFEVGDFMLIEDHINLTGKSPLTGANDASLGTRFPDMTFAYAPALREKALTAAEQCGTVLRRGVYIGVNGPQFETPAEIRAFRTLGADAVGMSTVFEVIAAAHCGLPVLGIAMITNMAAGVLNKPLSGAEVNEIAEKRGGVFREYVKTLVKTL